MSILTASNVEYTYRTRYQTVRALQGVSCEFEPGQAYAIVGRSGSGKTTLLSLLAGLDLPDSGEIAFEGEKTTDMDRDRYRREKVSVVYQAFHLFPLLTALENVMYPMELSGVSHKEAKAKARELLRRVELPEKIEKQYPKMMSGGEQQRVAIARALASNAQVLLADEPTGNLDSENSRNIIDILLDLAHKEGRCVILITHDNEIASQADHILRLKDGAVVEAA